MKTSLDLVRGVGSNDAKLGASYDEAMTGKKLPPHLLEREGSELLVDYVFELWCYSTILNFGGLHRRIMRGSGISNGCSRKSISS